MKGIIDNIITFYSIQAKALSILIANTQKALGQSEKERKANEQAERIKSFVKDLTMDLNNMLTRFHFHKDCKQMTNAQTRALVDFAAFVKTLAKQACSLLKRSKKSQTFEEKVDKEMKELEIQVKMRLKEYDEALRGTSNTLKDRLNKYISNKVESIKKFFRAKRVGLEKVEKAKIDSNQAYRFENAPITAIGQSGKTENIPLSEITKVTNVGNVNLSIV